MTIESRLAEWLKQPGAALTQHELDFIDSLRFYASKGVGYGWMQQVIEWEWQSKSEYAWGPEYFQSKLAELPGVCAAICVTDGCALLNDDKPQVER